MKKSILSLSGILVSTLLLSSCSGEQYYRYLETGENNFNAASLRCTQRAAQEAYRAIPDIPVAPPPPRQVTGETCRVQYNTIHCENEYDSPPLLTSVTNDAVVERVIYQRKAYKACMAELGWLPCSHGGTSADGCEQ